MGTTHGEVVALSVADGSELWRTRVGTEVGSAPTTGDGKVFVQTIDDRISAVDAVTGAVAWTYDSQMPLLTLRGTSAPVFDQGILYSGFANGKVVSLRAENGEPMWEQRVMLPEGRSELDRIVDVDARIELDADQCMRLRIKVVSLLSAVVRVVHVGTRTVRLSRYGPRLWPALRG